MNTGRLVIVFVAIVALIAGVTTVSHGQGANGNSPMDFVVGGGHHSVPDTQFTLSLHSGPLGETPKSQPHNPPTVSVTGVIEGAVYPLGAVPAAGCATTDAESGVRTPATLQITDGDASGVGPITATCAGAVDNAGNVAPPVSARYKVVAVYTFMGFAPPLGPGTTTVKGGSTVPLKFQILDSRGNLITDTSVIADIEVARSVSCSATSGDIWQDAAATGGTMLRFEATSHQFVFNSKTTGLAAGCYTVAVRTIDTLRHMAVTRAEPGTAGIPAIPGSPGGRQLPHGHRGGSWAVAPGSLTPPLTGC